MKVTARRQKTHKTEVITGLKGSSKDRLSKVCAVFVLVLIFLPLAACGGEEHMLEERVEIGVGNKTFTVEVARTEEQREKGLMHRKELEKGRGMLFVFERDQRLGFWMKNTEIPLALAYISQDGTIREIHDLEPLSERVVESSRAVRYALELNRGAFERAGAEVGDKIDFPEGWD